MPSSNSRVIRVLVVDDSFFMRKVLKDLLSESQPEIEVIDTASNGQEGLEKTLLLKPDVVTLDYEMPKLDGLGALKAIMAQRPTPVIMVSSHTAKGTEVAMKALEMGAVDCVAKPSGRALENIRLLEPELVEKIKVASICKPRIRPLAPDPPHESERAALAGPLPASFDHPSTFLVGVASSTGGPKALHDLFMGLKPHPSSSFVVVQHISAGFTQALVRRLGEVTDLKVEEASTGTVLMGGRAYVAPTGIHLLVEGSPGRFRFEFDDQPPRLGVKPCADIMLTTMAKSARDQCLGVVLTGMGKDGTVGLTAIRKAGGITFAQDPESCVVYGMPRSAVEAGVVTHQVPLGVMAENINQALSRFKSF